MLPGAAADSRTLPRYPDRPDRLGAAVAALVVATWLAAVSLDLALLVLDRRTGGPCDHTAAPARSSCRAAASASLIFTRGPLRSTAPA